MKLLLHFLLAFTVVFNATAQTPVTKQRVKMIRFYYSGMPGNPFGDSTVFRYSGTRGSVFNPLNYSDYRGYNPYPAVSVRTDMPEPFDDIYKQSIGYDTMDRFTMGTFLDMYTQYYNVFSGNNIVSHHNRHMSALSTISKIEYHTDQKGNIGGVYEMTADSAGAPWGTVSSGRYKYNDAGKVIADSLFLLAGDFTDTYTYNSNGQLVTIDGLKTNGTSQSIEKVSFLYNGSGKLVERIQEQYNTGTSKWDTTMDDHIRWDNLGRLKSFVTKHKPSMMQGDSTIDYTLHYKDADSKQPDTLVEYGYDLGGITQCNKTVFYYNEYGNPDSAINFIFSSCSTFAVNGPRTYYQYELYTEEDTTIIIPQPKGKLIVFPNPARDVIKIRWNEDKPASAHVYLYNSIGQVVGSTYIAKPQDEDRIMLPGLAAGVYYMRINTGGGGKLFAGSVYVY